MHTKGNSIGTSSSNYSNDQLTPNLVLYLPSPIFLLFGCCKANFKHVILLDMLAYTFK